MGALNPAWLKQRRERLAPGPRLHEKLLSRVPEIAALQKSAPPGCCAFCEEPIPPGTKAIRCRQPHCKQSYNRLFADWQRGQARHRVELAERARELADERTFMECL